MLAVREEGFNRLVAQKALTLTCKVGLALLGTGRVGLRATHKHSFKVEEKCDGTGTFMRTGFG